MVVDVIWVIGAIVLVLILLVWVTNLICAHYRASAITALTGLWADYDHVPYQLADDELDDMSEGLLRVVYDKNNTTHVVYQLDRQAAEDWFDAIKDGHVDWLTQGKLE